MATPSGDPEVPTDVVVEQENVGDSQDWYYRGIRLRKYRSPRAQVALVGFFAFMTV